MAKEDIEGILTIEDGELWFNDKNGKCRLRIQGTQKFNPREQYASVSITDEMIDIELMSPRSL